jgi:hypothetical protein
MCSVSKSPGPQLECQGQGQEHHRESAHAGRVRAGDQSHRLEDGAHFVTESGMRKRWRHL